ncbi:MAG: ABC transporter ATP-binding protein/permease [Lachnospiraceae bacterium]|nr:ABC transporter ATP-binding protein/permease [Lachnospiraceae bacterium]
MLLRIFKEVVNSSKKMFILNYGLTLLMGLLNAVPLIAMQKFFDSLIYINSDYSAFFYLGLFIFIKMLSYGISEYTNYKYEFYDLTVMGKMTEKTNQKVSGFKPVFFEDSTMMDSIEKAYEGTGRMRRVVDTVMMILLYYIPQIIVTGIYLFMAHPLLPLCIVMMLAVVIITTKIEEKDYIDTEKATSNHDRRINAYCDYIAGIRSFKETKLLGMQGYFLSKITKALSERKIIKKQCIRSIGKKDYLKSGILLFCHIAILSILLLCLGNKTVTIGIIAAVMTSLDEIMEMLEGLMDELKGGISKAIGKIKMFFGIQDVKEEKDGNKKLDHISRIDLRNVGFSYPGQEQPAVADLNLSIRTGEHIAVVGENGSGKSTLVKLLSGLYEPNEGAVLYNNTDINDFQHKSVYDKETAIFQNYGKYELSIRDNIEIGKYGSFENTEKNADKQEMDYKIKTILEEVCFDYNKYEKLDETILGREFGETDLSGGQWQRLAIARGLYRNGELMILDEPTSAIDPFEEERLYNLFCKVMKNKTAVIVTHRLRFTMWADRIVVMKDGKIVGNGSHKELMEKCNEYKRIWEASDICRDGLIPSC